MGAHYAIVGEEKVIELTGVISNDISGLEHIKGKLLPDDRRHTMKVDPSMVSERKKGEEVSNEMWRPVLTYEEFKRNYWYDSLLFNFMAFLLGAGTAISLYYWRVIELFSK
jgi:hypothetical protein